MKKEQEEREMDLKQQHQAELNALLESLHRIDQEQRMLEQEQIEAEQRLQVQINTLQEAEQQHQLKINALQKENEDLRDHLESRPWVVERD